MTVTGEQDVVTGPAPGPRMDPRIRQRRVQVRRDEGRRRLRFLLGSLAFVGLVGGAVASTRSPLMDVDRVELRGASRTGHSEVLATTGLDRSPLMVEVDTVGLARRVESLPWVLRARAARRWPDAVRIHVTEREPAAAVAAESGRWALVDGTGRILEVGPQRPADMPVVVTSGPVPDLPGGALPPGAQAPLRVAAELPPALRPRVGEVLAVAGGHMELRIRPAGVVRLGPPDALGAKLMAALTVLEKAAGTGFAAIDVRVPETPVLTRR